MRKYLKYALAIGTLGIVLVLTGATFAFFNYTRTGSSSELVVGDIYFNHTQGNTLSIQTVFPLKNSEARDRNDNVITLSITGLNESTEDIYYKFLLSHGDAVTGKNRIDDEYLRFDLIEILPNNEEKYIAYAETFDTINNTLILTDRVLAGTTSNITRNYRLRMWVSGDLLISDTDDDADYTTSEYKNLFASIKVTAIGDIPDVYYFSSFSDAAAAINNESITSNLTRDDALIGVYTDIDDGSINLVFYDDVDMDNDVAFSKPVNVNLYGHTLNFELKDDYATNHTNYTYLAFDDDFSLQNGIISGDAATSQYTDELYFYHGKGFINNIDFSNISEYNLVPIYIREDADLKIENSNIEHVNGMVAASSKLVTVNTHIDGHMGVSNSSTMIFNDSYIESDVIYPYLVQVYAGGNLVVNNSTIFADSPGCYWSDDTGFYNNTTGILNNGTMIFNSGYVFGTHSAVGTGNGSKTYVYGGTFESTHHGGFYFAHGSTGVAYIENANIRGISYPANGKYRPNGVQNQIVVNNVTYTLDEYKTAFYMGGETTQNNEKLYLVNCNISSEGQTVFVMRYSTPRQELYMSGCDISSTATNPFFRIDVTNYMKLYLGTNNDFNTITRLRNDSSTYYTFAEAKNLGTVVDTNAIYRNIVKPNDN